MRWPTFVALATMLSWAAAAVATEPKSAGREARIIIMNEAASQTYRAAGRAQSQMEGGAVLIRFNQGAKEPRQNGHAKIEETFQAVRKVPTRPTSDTAASFSLLPPAPPIPIPEWMLTNRNPLRTATPYMPACAEVPYRPAGFLMPAAERRRASLYGLMSAIACENGLPSALFDALIIRESRYDSSARSSKGAYGLTQLMPGTAAFLRIDRDNVMDNLRGGARYLRQQLDRFGRTHLALAAYNAGPGSIRNARLPPYRETAEYVRAVLQYVDRLERRMPGRLDLNTSAYRNPTSAGSRGRVPLRGVTASPLGREAEGA